MASLNGLRDDNAETNRTSLTFISMAFGENPLLAQRIMAFIDRCYLDMDRFDRKCFAREKAMEILGQAKACDSVSWMLEILTSDKEPCVDIAKAAAEAIGYIGLHDETYASIGEMLNGKEHSWEALHVILSLAKNANLHRGRAEEIMCLVDTCLYDACTTVKAIGSDGQYLIADCVEVLARAGALCGRDAIASFRHLHLWTRFVVDSDAVEDLSERVGEIRDQLSEEAARLLDGVLALYA